MIRLCVSSVLVCVLITVSACVNKQSPPTEPEARNDSKPEYFRAKHGYGGGFTEMVDLSKLNGFDAVQTVDDLARFASNVPGAIGFTAHPAFEKGERYAHAVLWYTRLTRTDSSWGLYLFDRTEAEKKPGDAPRAEAVAAAEAKVSDKMEEAKKLIEASGTSGVKLVGDYEAKKVLAFAVMRLDGFFAHAGTFGAGNCGGCRTVVPGGNPSHCGLGVQGKEHWNCCGGTDEKDNHCRYWELIKAQDDGK